MPSRLPPDGGSPDFTLFKFGNDRVMWGLIGISAGVALTLLVAIGTTWTVYQVEMSKPSQWLLARWAFYCCFTFLLLLVVPGALAVSGVIPSSPIVVAAGSLATSVVFIFWFLWLGKEWQKLNPKGEEKLRSRSDELKAG